MQTPPRKRLVALLAALFAILAGGGTLLITATPDDDTTPPATITVPVDTTGDGHPDTPLKLTPPARAELERGLTATETPGDTHTELADPLREPGDGPVVRNEGPLAASELDGCRNRFVANSSSRNGTAVRVIVWHQTVSHDTPGWADQDGLTAMANRPSSGVSWHVLIGGKDGNCTYTVPLNLKAWTQGNANQFSIGIETQAYGDEPSYVSGPGRTRLLAVTRQIAKRFDIPLQRGKVVNCKVVRPGVVMHRDLGVCGGGHVDVSSTGWQRNPSSPEKTGWDITPLIAQLAEPAGPVAWLTPTELRRIRELDAIRHGAKPAHPDRERVLVRVLTGQRQRIWRAAQPSPTGDGRGWTYAHRRARYASLLARTR